jgi:hypothetical protein
VVIKYHDKDIKSGISESDCFYDFTVWHPRHGFSDNIHVSNLIIDECSFYNRTLSRLNLSKHNEALEETNNLDNDGDNKNGVTFVNIPGALLP